MATATCATVDADHDLVIPFELTLKNTNASLSLPGNYEITYQFLDAQGGPPLDETVSVAQFFSDGPDCKQAQQTSAEQDNPLIALRLTSDLAAGQSATSAGYLILSGVVQPNFPSGDPAMLNNIYLSPQQVTDGPTITFDDGNWVPITSLGNITRAIAVGHLS